MLMKSELDAYGIFDFYKPVKNRNLQNEGGGTETRPSYCRFFPIAFSLKIS